MVRIPQHNTEVRLFLCGFADAPLASMNGKLAHESLPMWTLMRTGMIEAPDFQEHMIGMDRSAHLQATFSGRFETPLHSLKSCLYTLIDNQSQGLVRAIGSAFGSQTFFDDCEMPHLPGLKVHRVAALLSTERLRTIKFSVEEGFCIFLDKKNLERWLASKIAGNRVLLKDLRGPVRKIVKALGKDKITIKRICIPSIDFSSGKLTANLSVDDNDIKFVCQALSKWEKRSRGERLAAWDKAGKMKVW